LRKDLAERFKADFPAGYVCTHFDEDWISGNGFKIRGIPKSCLYKLEQTVMNQDKKED